MSNREIEKKFVLAEGYRDWLREDAIVSAYRLRQGYLTPPDSPTEVRIRHEQLIQPSTRDEATPRGALRDGKPFVTYTMTVKVPIAGSDVALSRHEFDYTLSRQEFTAIEQRVVGEMIDKLRVEYEPPSDLELPSGWHAIQVDTFRGHLQGLVLAEIEFDRWDQAQSVALPDVFARDVTDDPRYKNAALARAQTPPLPPTADDSL